MSRLGLPDLDEVTSSILEQLSLLLVLYPEAVFSLFGVNLGSIRRTLVTYRNSVQAFYASDHLTGLPTQTTGIAENHIEVFEVIERLRVFSAALSGAEISPLILQEVLDQLDLLADNAAGNLSTLIEEDARENLIDSLSTLETAEGRADLSSVEGYLDRFELVSGTAKAALASISNNLIDLFYDLRESIEFGNELDRIRQSPNILVRSLVSRDLLTILSAAIELSGEVTAGAAGDFTFPDDDLVLSGDNGRTFRDFVVIDEPDFFVTADPVTFDDPRTSRIKVEPPYTIATDFTADTVERPLRAGIGTSSPIPVTSGLNAESIGGNTIEDFGGLFLGNGVSVGDKILLEIVGVGTDKWSDVVGFGVSQSTQVVVAATLSILEFYDYSIYREFSNIIEDLSANFGSSLVGRRIEISGYGNFVVTRVLSPTQVEISESILPITFPTGPALPPVGVPVTYEIEPAGYNTLQMTSAVDLISKKVAARTPVRMTPAVGDQFDEAVRSVPADDLLVLSSEVFEGSYSGTILDQVQDLDQLETIDRRIFTIERVLSGTQMQISPDVESTFGPIKAAIYAPDAGSNTRIFHDPDVDFSLVEPGFTVLMDVGGAQQRALVDAILGANTLRLRGSLPVNLTEVSYQILRRVNTTTAVVDATATSFAGVLEGDDLAVSGLLPSRVKAATASQLTIDPELPESDEEAWAIVTRGGVEGWAHYSLFQERRALTTIPSSAQFRILLGAVLANLSDVGDLVIGGADGALIDPQTSATTTDRLSTTIDLSSVQFGDAIVLDTLVATVPTTKIVYVVESGSGLIRFTPAISSDGFLLNSPNFEIRRTTVSDALFELHGIELSLTEIISAIDGYIVKESKPLKGLLDYMESHGYDRGRDLLIEGDLETLASSAIETMSYAGRLQEALREVDGILGPEEDLIVLERSEGGLSGGSRIRS